MKAGLTVPLYLSFSWVLTVSYQLFTNAAVKTISDSVATVLPNTSLWLNTNIDTVVFIYAFTWIFVLSSVIPSAILGKQRSIITQYIVVLILTLIAFFIADILEAFTGVQIQQLFTAATFLMNPLLAGIYLAVPYLIMIGIDIRARKRAEMKKRQEIVIQKYQVQPEDVLP
jgi:hypothetical protein